MYKLVGYFVVGDGKFGIYEYGRQFVYLNDDPYWTNKTALAKVWKLICESKPTEE